MYITDIFLKTLLSIHFNFFPIFSQNLSSQTWGEAYTPVFTVFVYFIFTYSPTKALHSHYLFGWKNVMWRQFY